MKILETWSSNSSFFVLLEWAASSTLSNQCVFYRLTVTENLLLGVSIDVGPLLRERTCFHFCRARVGLPTFLALVILLLTGLAGFEPFMRRKLL